MISYEKFGILTSIYKFIDFLRYLFYLFCLWLRINQGITMCRRYPHKISLSIYILILFIFTVIFTNCARIRTPPGSEKMAKTAIIHLSSLEVLDNSHLIIRFDKAVELESVIDRDNYIITDDNGEKLNIVNIVQNRSDVVTLITEKMSDEVKYTVTILNLRDTEGRLAEKAIVGSFEGTGKVDDNSPSLVYTFPADGQEDMGVTSSVKLVFNDLIDEKTATGSVIVEDDLGKSIDFQIEVRGAYVYLFFTTSLDYSTEYNISISSSISDTYGNDMGRNEEITFITISDQDGSEISGEVSLNNKELIDEEMYVVISSTPNYHLSGKDIYGRQSIGEEGKFQFVGLSPNGKDLPHYYIYACVDVDGDNRYDFIGTESEYDVKRISLEKGQHLKDIKLNMIEVDDTGPTMTDVKIEPSVYEGGLLKISAFASDENTGGSKVKTIEIFPSSINSYGTGIELQPTSGQYGVAGEVGAGIILDDIDSYDRDDETLKIYVHSLDERGNWGEFEMEEIKMVEREGERIECEGRVLMELLPVENPVVIIYGEGEVLHITAGDEEGKFSVELPSVDRYEISAFLDTNQNGNFDYGEPYGETEWEGFGEVEVELSHRPDISFANAYIDHYRYGKDAERWILTLSALVSDEDYDLFEVSAMLPDNVIVYLNDQGTSGDKVGGDGVFTYKVELSDEELKLLDGFEVSLSATDTEGNTSEVDVSDFPQLLLRVVDETKYFLAKDTGEHISVNWEPPSVDEELSCVLFILPEEYKDISKIIKYSLWNNIEKPDKSGEIKIDRDEVRGYWGFPSGYEFYVYVTLFKDGDVEFEGVDKSIFETRLMRK